MEDNPPSEGALVVTHHTTPPQNLLMEPLTAQILEDRVVAAILDAVGVEAVAVAGDSVIAFLQTILIISIFCILYPVSCFGPLPRPSKGDKYVYYNPNPNFKVKGTSINSILGNSIINSVLSRVVVKNSFSRRVTSVRLLAL